MDRSEDLSPKHSAQIILRGSSDELRGKPRYIGLFARKTR